MKSRLLEWCLAVLAVLCSLAALTLGVHFAPPSAAMAQVPNNCQSASSQCRSSRFIAGPYWVSNQNPVDGGMALPGGSVGCPILVLGPDAGTIATIDCAGQITSDVPAKSISLPDGGTQVLFAFHSGVHSAYLGLDPTSTHYLGYSNLGAPYGVYTLNTALLLAPSIPFGNLPASGSPVIELQDCFYPDAGDCGVWSTDLLNGIYPGVYVNSKDSTSTGFFAIGTGDNSNISIRGYADAGLDAVKNFGESGQTDLGRVALLSDIPAAAPDYITVASYAPGSTFGTTDPILGCIEPQRAFTPAYIFQSSTANGGSAGQTYTLSLIDLDGPDGGSQVCVTSSINCSNVSGTQGYFPCSSPPTVTANHRICIRYNHGNCGSNPGLNINASGYE